MLRQIIRRGIDRGEFRESTIVDEPMVVIAPAVFAAIWKMTFEPHESLNTGCYLSAHVDLVLQGLKR